MRKLILASVALAALLAAGPSHAQQQDNLSLGALITNAAQAAGTVTALGPLNTGANGVTCTLQISPSTGSPSTTFSIQFQDTASLAWQTLAVSGSITNTSAANTTLMVYPGIQTSSLPAGINVATGLKVPRNWRVSQTVGGSGSITGTLGCDLLK